MDSHSPSNRFEAVNEILATALGLPPQERRSFVEGCCGTDSALQESVIRLLDKFDSLGDFLEEPALRPDRLQAGDLLVERFRVVRLIGAGGMGEVYEAVDQLLQETVALKLIRSAFRQSAEMESRFRSEIRLARKVAHPNVGRTFDVFSETRQGAPLLFFTMQYLQGTSLASRLLEGALPPADALAIASQIAGGLDAAHREGIIHRDLKPANIILVPAAEGPGHAVITDFGLARGSGPEPESGMTQTGQILGSPQYMAPEQFLGTEITPAADIYALALIIAEMVSGKRLFPDESIVRAAIRRTTQNAPELSGGPRGWSRPLSRALSRDPRSRPSTAGDLVRKLEKARVHIPGPSRRALIYIAGGLTVSSCALLYRYSLWRATPLPAAPVIMFVNASPPGTEGQNAAAFLTVVARQFGTEGIGVLPDARVHDAWIRMHPDGTPFPLQIQPKEARELALRAGANLVTFTGATRKLDDWSFWVHLEQLGTSPQAATTYWDREFKTSAAGDRFTASNGAAHWIRDTIGRSISPNTRERTPQELTTGNWEALTEYTQGNDAVARGDRESAIRHLKTALDLDPEFPLAANRMADVLNSTGRIDEALTFYSRAADLVRHRNLTDAESLQMRTLFALDTGQSAEAEQSAARWMAEYPDDPAAPIHRATALELLGQVDAALYAVRPIIARHPVSRPPLMCRALILLRAGRFDEANRDCEALMKIPPADSTWQLRGALAVARLDFNAAWDCLEQMRRTGRDETRSRAYALEGCQRAEQGRREEARQILRDGIQFDQERSFTAAALRKRRLLAQLLLLDRRLPDAREQCRLVLAANPGNAAAMEIGCILAQSGDLTGARACLRSGLPNWPIYTHRQSILHGEIALASGDSFKAFSLISSAAPDPDSVLGEWPASLARAAFAAHQTAAVMNAMQQLLSNPARYWFNADSILPGFMNWALTTFDNLMTPAMQSRAAALRQAITRSN